MLDIFHIPSSTGDAEVAEFIGGSVNGAASSFTWLKPRGKTMCMITLLGPGGNGGTGVIGANSTAAGGGGGGSGSQSTLMIPLIFLPDALFISLPNYGTGSVGSQISSISIVPGSTTANHLVLTANGGTNGGNASGATAGTAGSAATAAAVSGSPLAGMGVYSFLGGQAGIVGGTTVAAGALTLPTTGLIVTGGTGGGGLPATATLGTAGGAFTVPGAPTIFPSMAGGVGGSGTTTPPGSGQAGLFRFGNIKYFYGGTGSGSTHGSATGAGLVQANGGTGAPGCGGGGVGGALTGSTAGVIGQGGAGYCSITCW